MFSLKLIIQYKIISTPIYHPSEIQKIIITYLEHNAPLAFPVQTIAKDNQAELQRLSTAKKTRKSVGSALQVLARNDIVIDIRKQPGDKGYYRYNEHLKIIEHVSTVDQPFLMQRPTPKPPGTPHRAKRPKLGSEFKPSHPQQSQDTVDSPASQKEWFLVQLAAPTPYPKPTTEILDLSHQQNGNVAFPVERPIGASHTLPNSPFTQTVPEPPDIDPILKTFQKKLVRDGLLTTKELEEWYGSNGFTAPSGLFN